MMTLRRSRNRRGAAGLVGLSLLVAACGGSDEPEASSDAAAGDRADCAAFADYGDLSGTTISVYTTVVAPEDQPLIESFIPFEECTGADVAYEGTNEFETQLVVRIESGNAPDLAFVPQPGLLAGLVRNTDAVLPAPETVEANVDDYWTESWKDYGTVDGTFYAAPLSASVKSLVWYSPSAFEDAGHEIPQTWDELLALSDQIVAEGGVPWCAGIGSGVTTGWPLTDWMEDALLRFAGPEVYDQWVNREIPFDDPAVAEALERVGEILKNPDYVNGGLGDVQSIASTEFNDGGLPILDGDCWLHRQASFYQAFWPEGTTVAEDGDVFAFYLPGETADERPLLGAGDFVAAFADRPEVVAFQTYLASPEWANARAAVGSPGWVSANNGLDPAGLATPIDQLSHQLLTDESATFRFDASDLMPAEVGAGSFWSEMTSWIANDKPNAEVLEAIEGSWPE